MRSKVLLALLLALVAWNLAPAARAASFTVNSTGDASDATPGDGFCDTGTGECTLRAAIEEANAMAGDDNVHFAIPGSGPHTISTNCYPEITDPIVIDGTTQAGFAGLPVIRVDAQLTNACFPLTLSPCVDPSALCITAGRSLIRGLEITATSSSLGAGITLGGGSDNRVEQCYVHLSGSQRGISIRSSSYNLIGGGPGSRNVISGHGGSGQGVYIWDGLENLIEGNYIGTDPTGETAEPNGYGVAVGGASVNNVIGGSTPSRRNVISGNTECAIFIATNASGSHNRIEGNYIGLGASGLTRIHNGDNWENGAIVIYSSAHDVTIGGGSAGARNLISGNRGGGVHIDGSNVRVEGNWIGLDANGQPMGNWNGPGVWLGSAVGSGTGNSILTNRIDANGYLGIEFGYPDALPTPNDPLDGDSGPNGLQNYPVLSEVTTPAGSGTTVVKGVLSSTPSSPFVVQFFANEVCDRNCGEPECVPDGGDDAYGEGNTPILQTSVTTDGSGDASFTIDLAVRFAIGMYITATASDAVGNTSEFSQCEKNVEVPANVAVPANPPRGFGIVRVDRTPSRGPFDVVVVVPEGTTTSLDLLDVAGRRVAGRSVSGARELQTIRFDDLLAPGVYHLKLAGSPSASGRKIVIVR